MAVFHVVFINHSSSITFVYLRTCICGFYCLEWLTTNADCVSEHLQNQHTYSLFYVCPQEAYNRVTWVVPDPKKPSRTADGTPRLYAGAPPTDAEGQHTCITSASVRCCGAQSCSMTRCTQNGRAICIGRRKLSICSTSWSMAYNQTRMIAMEQAPPSLLC